MKSIYLSWVAVSLLLLALAGRPAGADSMVVQLIGMAENTPAPEWVRPGTRLVYYSAGASGAGGHLMRDPGGDLVNSRGERFRAVLKSSGGGHGYTQVDVVAADARHVAIETRNYVLMESRLNAPPVLAGSMGSIEQPGAGGDYWIHPKTLEAALRIKNQPGLLTGRITVTVEGRAVPAIYVALSGSSGHSSHTFDATSGVLLSRVTSSRFERGIVGHNRDTGDDYTGQGWSGTVTQLKAFRQVKVPWAGAPVPAAMAGIKVMVLEGATTTVYAGGPPVQLPQSARFDVLERGPTWLRFRHTQVSGGKEALGGGGSVGGLPVIPSTVERVTGSGQFTGLWIPPKAAAALRTRQVLESRDVYTHVTTAVAYVGMHEGRRVVVIREESPHQQIDFVYDTRSGGLVSVKLLDKRYNSETLLRVTIVH